MRRGLTWVAVLALAVPAGAHAQDGGGVQCLPPFGGVTVGAAVTTSAIARAMIGDQVFDLMQCWVNRGKVAAVDALITTGVAQATVHVVLNPDPFVNFSLATTNFVAGPVLMQFTFGTPIVPGFYNRAASSLSGGLTAGIGAASVMNSGADPFLAGNGTVAGAPAPPSIPGNLGVDIGAGPCVTAAPPALPTSVNCPAAPAAGLSAFPLTFYDDLDATVTYLQSGVLSQATFNGRVDLFTATPEPATLTLIGSGLLALGLAARARRNTV